MFLERVLIKKILSLTIFSILVPFWVYLGKSTRPTFGFKYETWIYSIPVSQRTLNLKRWAVYTGSHKGIDWWMSNTALKLHSLYFIFTICFSKNHVFEEFPAVSQEQYSKHQTCRMSRKQQSSRGSQRVLASARRNS